jgi:hypothetical protein
MTIPSQVKDDDCQIAYKPLMADAKEPGFRCSEARFPMLRSLVSDTKEPGFRCLGAWFPILRSPVSDA